MRVFCSVVIQCASIFFLCVFACASVSHHVSRDIPVLGGAVFAPTPAYVYINRVVIEKESSAKCMWRGLLVSVVDGRVIPIALHFFYKRPSAQEIVSVFFPCYSYDLHLRFVSEKEKIFSVVAKRK